MGKEPQQENHKPLVRTQFLIFTLFGDYLLDRTGEIWTSDLLYLMNILGVSERAVRSALSRMSRGGWLISNKEGRRSLYSLTENGRTLLEQGAQRIFEPIFTDWDDQWHMVLYSLPEKDRATRHQLRTQLAWLGFGQLMAGTWISPHDRLQELETLFAKLKVASQINIFAGQFLGTSSAEELVHQCWNLDELENKYQDFIDRFQQEYLDFRSQHESKQQLNPQDCFIRLFWLTNAFQSIPLTDPNLPKTLLSPDWRGFVARELFDGYRKLLKNYAHQYVTDVLANGVAS